MSIKSLRLLIAPVAASALLSVVGCDDSATPLTPEQDAKRAASEQAAMEKFHAANKKGKKSAAKPAEASGEAPKDEAPAETPKS